MEDSNILDLQNKIAQLKGKSLGVGEEKEEEACIKELIQGIDGHIERLLLIKDELFSKIEEIRFARGRRESSNDNY